MVERNILKYWYDMEFFSPSNPMVNKDTRYMKNVDSKIRWVESKEYILSYDVYIGKANVDDLVYEVISKTGINQEEEKIEKDNSACCLCAFKVDENKKIISGSFSISPFIYAMCKIINTKSINIDFNEEEISKINNKINVFIGSGFNITEQEMLNIYAEVMETLHLSPDLARFYCIINTKKVKKRNSKKECEKQDDKTDILESFYASDLRWVLKKAKSDDWIFKYINSLNNEIKDKIQIDIDTNKLKETLNPNNYPMGKWPSEFSPSVMQQVAINLSIDTNRKKFSVNGPPGTGKTTLLKEIIASYIVDRAYEMCKYNKPDEAFTKKALEIPFSVYSYYYEMDSKLSNYGILVASNNNKAVENITIELPKQKDMKQTLTNLFYQEDGQDLYYTNLANNLIDKKEECWGLISARLGNKSNISKFNKVLWYDADSLRNISEKIDWEKAKQNFIEVYDKVLNYRKYILKAISDTEKYELKDIHTKKLKENLNQQKKLVEEKDTLLKMQNKIEVDLVNQDDIIKDIKNKMNILQKIVNAFKTNNEIVNVLNKRIELRNKKQELFNNIYEIENQLGVLKKQELLLKNKVNECELLKSRIDEYKKVFGNNYADNNFWKNLTTDSELQTTCPWTCKEYDKLREELFYNAIKLQKAFIVNSVAVKYNLGLFVNINECKKENKQLVYQHVLNTIFLIVPVISTTFASVSKFLDGIQKEQLATLIIDEAGQAAPGSSIGAIWRFKKSIIVGDPLQVEPVITIPKEIAKIFAKKHQIPQLYKKSEISVQNLADNLNKYGGYRNNIWVGCPLTVHRRCISPMFDISNKIAYNGKMVNKTKDADDNEKFVIKKSKWIDIKGKEIGNKNHFVNEQGEKALQIISEAINVYNGLPNIYIISPFKSVVGEIKSILKKQLNILLPHQKEKIDDWLDESIGTVHTFQGKEAKEVLLVLGCDKTSTNAAKWAGKSVNLLNVAITRAKYRIAIIGDKDIWKNVNYFSDAIKILDD